MHDIYINIYIIYYSPKSQSVCVCLNQAPSPRSKPRHEASSRSSHPSNSPPQYKLHSFSLLNYDRERLERKVFVCVYVIHPPI